MRELLPHIPVLATLAAGVVGSLFTWARMRRRDEAEVERVHAETEASDAEVGRLLREELRAEIAKLRAEQERRDAECERRLKAMEQTLADAQRVAQANGRVIAKQADTIDRLKARVTELEGKADARDR